MFVCCLHESLKPRVTKLCWCLLFTWIAEIPSDQTVLMFAVYMNLKRLFNDLIFRTSVLVFVIYRNRWNIEWPSCVKLMCIVYMNLKLRDCSKTWCFAHPLKHRVNKLFWCVLFTWIAETPSDQVTLMFAVYMNTRRNTEWPSYFDVCCLHEHSLKHRVTKLFWCLLFTWTLAEIPSD